DSGEPGKLHLLFAQVLEQWGGDVALAEGTQDREDSICLVLRLLYVLQRTPHGCTAGDTTQHSLAARATAGGPHGLAEWRVDHAIEDILIEGLWEEVRAQTLDLVRAETAFGQQRGICRLDADDRDALLLRLQVLRSAGDGATGADARDEDVDL